MSQKDWSRFSMRIIIRASMPDVYNAWTSENGILNWFLRKAEFTTKDGNRRESYSHIQKGDTYVWM